jgi:hypothetical protein
VHDKGSSSPTALDSYRPTEVTDKLLRAALNRAHILCPENTCGGIENGDDPTDEQKAEHRQFFSLACGQSRCHNPDKAGRRAQGPVA